MANTFQCTVVTPQEQMLDQQVSYASIPAWDGQIGLLPQRAPLMVKLGDGALRLDYDGQTHWYFVSGGFAQMKDNRLALLADDASDAGKLDREEITAMLKEATARVATTVEDVEKRTREINRAKAMLELLENV